MNEIRILCRRDVRSWLMVPSFHLMATVFLAVSGLVFWMFAVTMAGKGMLTSEITFSGMLFWMALLAVASAVSVKLLGDDQEQGTIELLLTAPVTELHVILAKTLAGFVLIMILAVPAVIYPWILRAAYPAWRGMDVPMWLAGVLLLALMAGLMTLAGLFWSQVFKRQTAAMVATFLTGAMVVFRGSVRSWIGGGAADGSSGFVAVASHISSFVSGMVDSRAVVFYVTAMAVLLFLNVRLLQLSRYRRAGGRANVVLSFFLAVILAGLVNYVALLHPFRVDVSTLAGKALPVAMEQTLKGLKTPARVILLAPAGDPLAVTARRVVEKYRYAHPLLEIEIVDESSEVVRTRDLAGQYKLRESHELIVACDGRYKVIPFRSLARISDGGARPDQRGSTFSASLDAELVSALRAVSQETAPVVYFLTGHGERDITDFSEFRGYAEIAGIVRERYAEIRPLLLDSMASVTNDCSVLVVAGPTQGLAAWEVVKIRDYLGRSGRLMLLLDSGSKTGLESLLEAWGVRLGQDRVIDSPITTLLPGSRDRSAALGLGQVPVIRYGAHPVCDRLNGLVSSLVLPRSVDPLGGNGRTRILNDQADKPLVVSLAFSSERSWAETDFNQNPPQYNEGYDWRGPVSLAVCVEKGMASAIAMDIKPVRMVVFGDSQFAANRCLAGGNESLFINALEWLLERGDHAEEISAPYSLYTLQIDAEGRVMTFVLIVVAVPLLAVGAAVLVRLARRDRRSRGRDGA